ncbi:hypothetical protein SAMN05661091_1811 [Paenibacillus uliginis N3/975]|uniref:Uncharacterized protein n=1 Tax=Paenibacillus uliginis N3/975 TaxID=1313296 RepID=A0A1X7H5P1_9BACL|nr:DUF5682 family protein [Paenibacillus uliginis]SMF80219.1 hypothetical protein SAMN05661091_1811 [Paenibacillus uliginis N3/975]
MNAAGVHIFGVRHLSPAGAKHLLDFLDDIRPTAVLIEGPSDATSEIRHLTNMTTKPPVAILAFTEDLPVRTVLWPFAVYSPEYQAMKWAQKQGAYTAFIDLPSSSAVCMQDLRSNVVRDTPDGGENEGTSAESVAAEPMDESQPAENSIYGQIAELAGEYDYDMYWERSYEHNLNTGAYQQSILAFSKQMRELSEEKERREDTLEYAYNAIRESYMRRQIVEVIEAGHKPEQIVVVCGAYHASALTDLSDRMDDEELKNLPSRGTKLTLMPYSYYKLSSLSGYGAGNIAPQYFEMMWDRMVQGSFAELPHHYLSMVAGSMRKNGTHRSTAEVIEAVRLAESLAALHGGSAPTLRDLRDAAQTLLGRGELAVVAEELARTDIGTSIGELAEGVSQTPIQDDLNRQLKRLKLEKYKSVVANDLILDLRENRRVKSEESAYLDLNRSFLFHRLKLLGIDFVSARPSGQEQAAWAEHWVVKWTPEVEIQIVESTLLGETVEVASAYVLQQKLTDCSSIEEASSLIRIAYECGMIHQMEEGRQTLQRLAVDSRDVMGIAAASRELSILIRYGGIRRMDTQPLVPLLQQLFMRACLFLLDGSQCSDEVSGSMITALNELNSVAMEHVEQVDEGLWLQELQHLSERDDRNPRLSGYACAILMERNAISAQQCAEEVSRRLSPGIPADLGAGWFEGMSMRNRYGLLSRLSLWEQLNEYILSLEDDEFTRALVFLRRAFSTFSPKEKTMIAELLGELWGVNSEQAAEILTGDLKEEEVKMIDDLNDFDFEDF